MASNPVSKPRIAVYAHFISAEAASFLESKLKDDSYFLRLFSNHGDLMENIEARREEIDCLVLEAEKELPQLLTELRSRAVLLPTIILKNVPPDSDEDIDTSTYHTAVFWLESRQVEQLPIFIDNVINQFLKMPLEEVEQPARFNIDERERALLVGQQQRLADKLRERLGYLSVYYKRDPDSFLRHMSADEKEEFLNELKQNYQEIILNYFTDDPLLNQKIDNYVNSAFFADVPVVQIVEIHMDLMDAFSKQLKLEGRSDEILLDYRLTLIDAISNLCEMYRRSVPRQS